MRGEPDGVLLVIEADGQVAGGIEFGEENEPMYRHAGIDIYLSRRLAGARHRGGGHRAAGRVPDAGRAAITG